MRIYTRKEWLKIAFRLDEISAQLDEVESCAILSGDDRLLANIRVASLQASLAAAIVGKNARKDQNNDRR